MLDVILDALLDTLKLLPWLVLLYILIELIEHKTKLNGKNNRLNGKIGPLVGAATGLIPQCGFSVMAAKLYEQKYITVGTLLAIFISTSDEAFIILLSSGQGSVWLLPMIAVKICVGVAVGYAVNGLLYAVNRKRPAADSSRGEAYDAARELLIAKSNEFECTSCGRDHEEGKPWKVYFLSPLLHALKVAAFVFLVNLVIGFIVYGVTEERFFAFLQRNLHVQPFISSLVGLIPNCASSVVITESFLRGGISFGSCAAGLCSNAGLGFVVLLKNTKAWKRNLLLILSLYLVSVGVGLLLNLAVSL